MTDSESPADRMRRSRPADPWPKWLRIVVRIVLTLLGLAASAALAVVMVAAIALAVSYPNLPEIDSLTDYRPKLPMRVFSADGVLLGEFGEERRNFVPIAQIPKVMQDAVLAVEDARFYKHKGVDYLGALRAGLANFGEGHTAQGASTITMQVARNFYLSTEKTFTRKIYEMLLSLKIESLLSKEQILEVYMNHIALGQRAEVRAVSGRDDDRGGRAADHVGAHEADVLELERAAVGQVAHRLGWHRVFLDRQRLAGERGLRDEQVLRRQQPKVGRNHVAGREHDDVARHQVADRRLDLA